ncbi:MAG: hypothetical protein WDN45_14500 [Caulobacteraceae bacterium]
MPERQTRVVADGDSLSFGPVKVLAALARHSTIQDGLTAAHRQMYEVDELAPLSAEQNAHDKEITAKGTFSPDVIDKGTMGFAMVAAVRLLDRGVRHRRPDHRRRPGPGEENSAAPTCYGPLRPAPGGRAPGARLVAYVETFEPRLVLPTHHDAIWGACSIMVSSLCARSCATSGRV